MSGEGLNQNGEPEEKLAEVILAKQRVKCASLAGLISAGVAVFAPLISSELPRLAVPAVLDAVLIALLSIAVAFRSRAAAVLLFLYFVVSRLYDFAQFGTGIFAGLVFGYFFLQGVQGAFSYARLTASAVPTRVVAFSPAASSE